jgi:hypothetical protein
MGDFTVFMFEIGSKNNKSYVLILFYNRSMLFYNKIKSTSGKNSIYCACER